MIELTRNQTVFMAEHADGRIYIVERSKTRGGALNKWTWWWLPKEMVTPDQSEQHIFARHVPKLIRLKARLHFTQEAIRQEEVDAFLEKTGDF